jgi:hypothetical protein
MGNIKREQKSFVDQNDNFNYWCAECERWHCRKATTEEIILFKNKDK